MESDAPAQPQTTPIYDISGPKPVLGDMPHDQVGAAVGSGKYSFPKGQDVNVVAPDGTFGTVPAEQAPDALKNGYQYATPDMLGAQAEKEAYQTPGQQAIGGLEAFGRGLVGPLAPLAERAFGVDPEDIRGRQENQNPWVTGGAEALGFGTGIFTGSSEASLLGHAGEAAAGALGLGGEGANIGSRLAAGAAKMATEMGLYQAGDEATKAILNAPDSVGDAAANVGLSALLGAAAGAPLAAVGMGAKALVNGPFLKGFADRLAARGAELGPNELLQNEVEAAVNGYHEMGSEVGGANGIKAQALKNVLPDMGPKILDQSADLIKKTEQEIERLGDDPNAKLLRSRLDEYVQGISGEPSAPGDLIPKASQASSEDVFDATNRFKQQLHEWGKVSKLSMPDIADRAFIKSSQTLGGAFRGALEDPDVWGRAAELQTKLNDAWSSAIEPAKQIETKFMSAEGNTRKIDPVKFNSYVNQAGRVTGQTNKQGIMKLFADAMDKFHDATSLAYERAGIENPHPPISTTAMRESLNKPTMAARMADLWYDKLGAQGLGSALGAGVGGVLGHATGLPEAGLGGALLGKQILGPAFSSVIKPLLEKGVNMPAFKSTMAYSKAVLAGDHALTNAAGSLFGAAGKTLPPHLFPEHAQLEKLDDHLKDVAANPQKMLNVAGNLGDYMPDHAQALSQTAMTAVNYLNSQRPSNPKQSPLDSDIPVSKAQNAPYFRSLAIAEQPLMAIQHMKDGTLLPQDVQTVKTLYPSYYNKMSQEITSAMTDHLSDKGTVPYRLRQSMSLFLGQPLDSTMTPASMQSIQAIYAQNKSAASAQPGPGKSKGAPSKLNKISSNLATNDQSRAERADKG